MDLLTINNKNMKKFFTLICGITLLGATASAAVTKEEPANVTDLKNVLDAERSAGDVVYIYLKGSYNLKSYQFAQTARNYHFIGIDDEEGNRAELLAEFGVPKDNTVADHFSCTFENLVLKDYNGEWSFSKHFMNFKDAVKHYVDTLAFRNCEITNLCRSFYRGEAQNKEDHAGTLGVFEMTNCVFHNAFRQSSAMPMVYLAQPVNEITFRNNTFYDLTYLNSIVSMGNLTEATGIKDIKFTFENNTVCAWSKSTLFNFGENIGGNSEIHIKNNIFLMPNWADDANNRFGDLVTKEVNHHGGMTTIEENPEAEDGILSETEIQERIENGCILTSIPSGLVQLENNMLYGYKYQKYNPEENFDIIPIGDTEKEELEGFTSMSMEEAGFAWTDFVDAQNDMFQINENHAVHSAGKNGAPLGDTNNYTSQVFEKVSLTVSVEGSETVSFTIDPVKEQYFSGDKVTITLFDHNNALRTINKFLGWSDGSDETVRSIELTSDLNLVAKYEAAIPNIVSWFDFATTPAAGQNKLASYEADVYAEGNQAVATMFFVPSITDEEGNATGLEEAYKQADGSENRFNWRGNKFGEDAVEQQIGVLSRKTSQLSQQAGKPDYFVFTFSTTGLKNVEFSAFCGTDNFGYKTQLADYSLDGGATWTNFAKVDLESRDAEYSIGTGKLWGWTELKGILPAAAEGKESVMVRVIGDTKGEKIDNVISEIDQETANMFEYTGSVLIRHSVEGGQEETVQGDVNGDGEVDVADISQVIAIMAAGGFSKAADVNGDGLVDVADISQVISIMARSN